MEKGVKCDPMSLEMHYYYRLVLINIGKNLISKTFLFQKNRDLVYRFKKNSKT